MADIKKSAQEAGQKIADTAKSVGNKISEGAEKATDWVKEKAHEVGQKASHAMGSQGGEGIRERMDVISSCGCNIGTVDHVEGSQIKLTKNGPHAGGQHHFIPMGWVDHVDQHVHLNKNSEEARRDWKPDSAAAV